MRARTGSSAFDEGSGPPDRAAGLPPPAERGATVVPDRVVARIAVQAARTARARNFAVPPGGAGVAAPGAFATVRTGSVRLHLTMELPYPADLPRVCARIRQDVAERVARLTGLQVGEVTLTVQRLVTAAGDRGRVR